MKRYFNNQEVELLAPAGNFEIFKKVIHSGADAVYFGGKVFNMRMHRKDFNFTNEEVEEAIKLAHSLNKKVYITVNNLLSSQDLEIAEDYLKFIEKASPDAIIVQDMSIIELINKLNLKINIHSSVMMNVHNLETIKALEKLNVTRVVTSRDIDLQTLKVLSTQTDMEFEYFVHGDMCVAHGSQCTYSGLIFGKSSNRGLCMKPCRWNYTVKKGNQEYKTTFPLAVKDMYMYENIPELIEAGVVSFKIEGRMRDAEYLINLINLYSDAIDRYIEDPIFYDRKKNSNVLFESRKRDFSTAYAFGNPGLDYINQRYEGTGKFYSTGKVFSNPVEEIELQEKRIDELKEILRLEKNVINKPKLSVKVNSYDSAQIAIEEGIDNIYLSGDVYEPNLPFTKSEILNLTKNKQSSKIYICLPRMMFEEDFSKYNHYLRNNNLGIDGILVTNLGALNKFKDLPLEMIGDYSLNIYNSLSGDFYKKQGLSMATLSIESPITNLKDAITNSNLPFEVIVHGSPAVMYMSLDIYENTNIIKPQETTTKEKHPNALLLVDDKGHEHPIYRDNTGKNHLHLTKELSYLPILKELYNLGVTCFRIEGCHYDKNTLRKVLHTYKLAINDMDKCNELFNKLDYACEGFTLGALQFS